MACWSLQLSGKSPFILVAKHNMSVCLRKCLFLQALKVAVTVHCMNCVPDCPGADKPSARSSSGDARLELRECAHASISPDRFMACAESVIQRQLSQFCRGVGGVTPLNCLIEKIIKMCFFFFCVGNNSSPTCQQCGEVVKIGFCRLSHCAFTTFRH